MTERTIPAERAGVGDVRASAGIRAVAGRLQRTGVALAVIVTCQLMLILDGTVVNIALPQIQQDLHFSATGLSWVISAYTLTFGGLLLLGGRAGDILGRRKVFVAGIGLFTLASLLGGLAPSAGLLLAARALQGIGAAIAAPSTLALIVTTFANGPERNRAIGIYSTIAPIGGALGLILGGVFTSLASWRWGLFVNVPIGVAVLALAPLSIRESERIPGRFDLAGALTSTAGMTALVYGFIRASTSGWGDALTLGSFAGAVVLLALLLAIEARADQPIMPLHLFADRTRVSAYLSMFLVVATMFSMFFFLTQFQQHVLGFSALKAGLAFLPLTLGIIILTQLVPRILPRTGPEPPMLLGAVLLTAGMVWITRLSPASGYAGDILGPLVLFGIGAGSSFVALTMASLNGVRPEESGAASGLLQAVTQTGGTLGLAILVNVFGRAMRDGASSAPPAAVTEAQQIIARAIASAFSVGVLFAACTLLVALVAVGTKLSMGRRAGV
jgi:EmrB/QacA subfamily drug resistance transporter